MNHINYFRKHTVNLLCGALLFAMTNCTDDFKEINTDPNGVDESVTELADKIQAPLNNIIPPQEHRYQLWANLTTDIFAGFMMGVNDFGGSNNYNYKLRSDHSGQVYADFYLYVFKYTKQYIPQCKELGRFELAAIMQIANVCGILPALTAVGPVQYSCVKEGSSTYYYDSEEVVYKALFADLKEAIQWLRDFRKSNPSEEDLATFTTADKMCNGDMTKWIRFANTLRLRIAMQLVKVDPALAKEEAEAAVADEDGVLTSADKDVVLQGGLRIALIEDLWNDARANANIISILQGYNDPRLERWFSMNGGAVYNAHDEQEETLEKQSQYIGVRPGVPMTRIEYQPYSKTNRSMLVPDNAARPVCRVAEAYFLRAEGALRNWNMGGSPQGLYEDGIRSAMENILGEGVGAIDDYLNGMTFGDDFDWVSFEGGFGSTPYINYRNQDYNYTLYDVTGNEEDKAYGVNRISVKWHEEDSNEQKLQRIITQKWLAFFPTMSSVAWTEFRRTGYPKLIPIPAGTSKNDAIQTKEAYILGVRRVPFTQGEYNSNREEVMKACSYLSGPDNEATRLWWDVDTDGRNF